MFGMSTAQVARAAKVLDVVAKDWRELSVGSEGFLAQKGRAGLLGHRVVWGEMDSMVCPIIVSYGLPECQDEEVYGRLDLSLRRS